MPRSSNPSSTEIDPLTPSTGTRRGGEEESRAWVRGPTCTRNNWFYLAGAREPWLFDVLCGAGWRAGSYTRERQHAKRDLFHSHNDGGSQIAMEKARAGYPRRCTCGIDLRCRFSLTVGLPMPWLFPPYTRLACSSCTCCAFPTRNLCRSESGLSC